MTAILAVDSGRNALDRLAFICKIPGHHDFAAAARAFYQGKDASLRQRVRQIERVAGFTIIDRDTSPLEPTSEGEAFLREARALLTITGRA